MRDLVWLVGRGLTASCGLTWETPAALSNAKATKRIREELERAQAEALEEGKIDHECLERFARAVKRRPGWRHRFVTTNWDTLLDGMLERHGLGTVLHLNGSIDADSELLTEDDGAEDAGRRVPYERRAGFRCLIDARDCVVVGLSFHARPDRELVHRVGRAHPCIEECRWLVVNEDAGELDEAAALLRQSLGRACVIPVCASFEAWAQSGMPELAK